MKKYGLVFGTSILGAIFRAFVLMNLWNWFVTTAFHISEISFLQTLGISLVISTFSSDAEKFTRDEKRWEVLMTTLEHCVPEDKKAELKEELKHYGDTVSEMWGAVGGQFIGNAVVLFFGFIIHLLI